MLGRNPRISCVALCAVYLMLIGLAERAVADGILRDGIGAIPTGRGGTNLGFADNGNLILDNPGALVNVNGQGLSEFGFDVLITDLTYQDLENGRTDSADNPFPMGQLSFVRKSADGNVAWGLGAFPQAGFSPKYELNAPAPFSSTQIYKSVGAMMRILPGVSVALTSRLSVGATLGVAVSHTELEGPYFTQSPTPFQGTPTILDLQGTGAGLSWSVGLQYQLSARTTLGVIYQGETKIDADGSARLTIPGFGVSAFDMELATEWPSTLGIGIAHQLTPCAVVAVDVLWTAWSNSKHGYEMALTNPTNPAFAILGPRFPERFPLEWQDSVAVRVGLQRCIGDGRVVRAGYVYHPNPIPDETLTPFIQSIVEHSVSVGYGWQRGPYSIDLGYQFMFGPDQNVGTSGLIGGDFSNAETTASAHWILTSIVRRF